ncbi:hypothetical protein ABK040_012842 [Willaertia magna]
MLPSLHLSKILTNPKSGATTTEKEDDGLKSQRDEENKFQTPNNNNNDDNVINQLYQQQQQLKKNLFLSSNFLAQTQQPSSLINNNINNNNTNNNNTNNELDTMMDSYSKKLLQIKSPRYGSDFKISEEGIQIKGMNLYQYRKNTNQLNNYILNFPVSSLDDFHKLPMKELGKGSFGIVYRISINHPITNEKIYFAEKRVTDISNKQMDLIFREVKTIFECDSPYLVRLHDCFYKECTYFMIIDYMSLGSLDKVYTRYKKVLNDIYKKQYSFPESVISMIISKTLKGLLYLHVKKHVIHRDLKPHNILMDDKGYVKISDFGLVGIKEEEKNKSSMNSNQNTNLTIWSTYAGSVTYMSPERLNGQPYSYNSDIFSVGIITVELFLGQHPFSTKDMYSLALMTREEMCQECITKLKQFKASDELCSFVETCLLKYKDLEERPDINGIILQHPFIKQHENTNLRSWIKNEYIAKCYARPNPSSSQQQGLRKQ